MNILSLKLALSNNSSGPVVFFLPLSTAVAIAIPSLITLTRHRHLDAHFAAFLAISVRASSSVMHLQPVSTLFR
jgi:hypothetical protein